LSRPHAAVGRWIMLRVQNARLDMLSPSKAMRGNLHSEYFNFYERDLEFKAKIVEVLVNLWEMEQVL
jgi:hypothetical protein